MMNLLHLTTETVTESVGERGEPVLRLTGISDFDVGKTFDCGQCFRFSPVEGSSHGVEYGGVVRGRYVTIAQDVPHEVILKNVGREDYDGFFRRYLALDTDYAAVNQRILGALPSGLMPDALRFGRGIRILRQDGWEALCSFILSQNNNIPRIRSLITALCANYGERFSDAYGTHYAFPTAEALAAVSVKALYQLRMGFRAKYLADAARLWVSGELETDRLSQIGYAEAEQILMRIHGVGPKVAACALLFGFGHTEAFPVDVWIKRVLAVHFPNGFPLDTLGDAAGIAQQYLFYYGRYSDLFK